MADAMAVGSGADLPVGTEPSRPAPSSVVRLAAGEFAAVAVRIWRGPRLAEFLTASDRRRHTWLCWLAGQPEDEHAGSEAAADAAYRRLTRAKGKELVADAHGSAPRGIVAALGQVGAAPRRRGVYLALVRALARDDLGAKVLRRRPQLSDAFIVVVAALPTRLQTEAILGAFDGWREHEAYLAQIAWTAHRLDTLVAASAGSLRRGDVHGILGGALDALPFPPPLWPGSARLRPLTSINANVSAGEQLQLDVAEPWRAKHDGWEVLRGNPLLLRLVGRAGRAGQFQQLRVAGLGAGLGQRPRARAGVGSNLARDRRRGGELAGPGPHSNPAGQRGELGRVLL